MQASKKLKFMKGSHSRAPSNKKIRSTLHMGWENNWKIVTVQQNGEERKMLNFFLPHKKALMDNKRDFLCVMSRFHMRLRFLYQIENILRFDHQVSLKSEENIPRKLKNRKQKGQGTQKGFSLSLRSLVFIVLMLIRCIASLPFLFHPRRQRREICLIERGYKLPSSPVYFFLFGCLLKDIPLFFENTKSAKTCGWSEITGWDF